MKEIPLTRGLVALVDDEDFDYLMQWKWLAQRTDGTERTSYACRADYESPPPGKRRVYRLMHREVLLRFSEPTGRYVDHINGNRLDNRRVNLRWCSASQNSINKQFQKHGGESRSKYRGVSWVPYLNTSSPWFAFISVHGKRKHLGYFADDVSAARAYDAAAIKHHGEFAKLNFSEAK